jgi:ferric-dicitrate binding protein FerR (iron transport regulator)
MTGAPVHVDDEVLFRVITGGATETEREAVGMWLQSSSKNVTRFRELAAVLEALGEDERSMPVRRPPTVSGILARARLGGGKAPRERPRPIVGPLAVGVTSVILAVGAFVKMHQPAGRPDAPFGGEQWRTGPRQSMTVTLHDGTQVELGPQSAVMTELRGEDREVLLDGRASFQVAHQGARAFVVRTPLGEVRDIGTQFSVRVDSGSTRIAVFEGRVGFSNDRGSAEARAGQMIVTLAGDRPIVAPLGAGHSASDWVRAELVFEGTTIDEIARVIQHHYGVPVHVADPAVGRRTVTAWFEQEPTLEDVFNAVCRAVDAKCRVEGSARVISQAFAAKETL